ncbi:TPA: hypothetical protein ACF5TK_000860 [Klebsiella pneumoniae]
MTTDITELAQRMKAAAIRAKAATEDYVAHRMSITVCLEECKEFNDLSDGPDNILALVEALEKAQRAQPCKHSMFWDASGVKRCSKCDMPEHENIHYADAAEMEITVLRQRIAELESFRTAYMEWSDKTDWVRTDRRFDVVKPLGKHIADVLKAYIEHLESPTFTFEVTAEPFTCPRCFTTTTHPEGWHYCHKREDE